jgi:hypothetical protein
MKKFTSAILLIAAMMLGNNVQAQTLDEILSNHINALGGKEKLLALTTVKMEGNLNVQGTDVSVISTRKHLVGSRVDISVMGTENYQLVTPEKGWVFMPIQGQSAPEEMSADQFKAGVNMLDLQGPFLNYKEKGNSVELAGSEKVEGNDCFKLKVTFKNGNQTDYYINSKTWFIDKTSTKLSVNGESIDAATTFSNYKQNADGYWFSYSNNSTRGELNYDKIETNIKVEDSIFKAN